MLRLTELRIEGFRCFQAARTIPIRPGMTVLTGQNGSGKTATLDALELLLGTAGFDQEDTCCHYDGEPAVYGVLVDVETQAAHELRARLEGGRVVREALTRAHRIFDGGPEAHTLPQLKALMAEAGVESPGGTRAEPYQRAVSEWLAGRPPEEFSDVWLPVPRELVERLPEITSYRSASAVDPEGHVRAVVSQEVRRLLRDEGFSQTLDSVGEQVGKAVLPVLAKLKDKILDYCADVDDVVIAATPDFTRASVSTEFRLVERGGGLAFSKSGEGKKRRVTLAIHEAGLEFLEGGAKGRAQVVVYDEPDTHLDYRSQRELFAILLTQSEMTNVQVVVATHSLNFIDKVPLRAIAHYLVDDDGATDIEVLDTGDAAESEFLGSVVAGLGLRNSVLLDERVFLMVEGDTEETAMPGWFRSVTGDSALGSGVVVFNAQSSGALRKIAERLKMEWKRELVVLLDLDQRSASAEWVQAMGLDEGRDLFFVGSTKELEDAFTDEQWVRVLDSEFAPADGGGAWSVDDLSGVRTADKYSKALLGRVRARCRDSSIGKPDLGLALSRVLTDAAELPEELVSCIRAAAGGIARTGDGLPSDGQFMDAEMLPRTSTRGA